MSDIVVTTPKNQMKNAAQEAQDCLDAGGGWYFRRLYSHRSNWVPSLRKGERVWYVEDGYLRGYCKVDHLKMVTKPIQCDTTGIVYQPGFYVIMRADSWKWVHPVPYRGFQGWRYFNPFTHLGEPLSGQWEVGDWKSPRPVVNS